MRAMAPKGPASQRRRNARGHGPLLQAVLAAKAILPSLPNQKSPSHAGSVICIFCMISLAAQVTRRCESMSHCDRMSVA
jgi:hypothetical protein